MARKGRTVAFVEVKWRASSAALDQAIDARRIAARGAGGRGLGARVRAGPGDDVRIDVILVAPWNAGRAGLPMRGNPARDGSKLSALVVLAFLVLAVVDRPCDRRHGHPCARRPWGARSGADRGWRLPCPSSRGWRRCKRERSCLRMWSGPRSSKNGAGRLAASRSQACLWSQGLPNRIKALLR